MCIGWVARLIHQHTLVCCRHQYVRTNIHYHSNTFLFILATSPYIRVSLTMRRKLSTFSLPSVRGLATRLKRMKQKELKHIVLVSNQLLSFGWKWLQTTCISTHLKRVCMHTYTPYIWKQLAQLIFFLSPTNGCVAKPDACYVPPCYFHINDHQTSMKLKSRIERRKGEVRK